MLTTLIYIYFKAKSYKLSLLVHHVWKVLRSSLAPPVPRGPSLTSNRVIFYFWRSPRHIFAQKKRSLGPKTGLERRVWQSYTICDKNQLLNEKKWDEKVTVILVLRSWNTSCRWNRALRKSFYGALWSKRTVPAVTFHPNPPKLGSASILQNSTVLT